MTERDKVELKDFSITDLAGLQMVAEDEGDDDLEALIEEEVVSRYRRVREHLGLKNKD